MQSRKLALPVTFAALIGFAALPAQAAEQVAPESSSLGAAVVDATITAKVKARFLNDARLKNAQITVTTAGGVKVDAANVVKTDIAADNGVIHVIDSVIMPK